MFNTYEQLVKYVLKHKLFEKNGCSMGRVTMSTIPVTGDATFTFNTKTASKSRIKVKYRVPAYGGATEDGKLSDWFCGTLAGASDFACPYGISARWQPEGTGGGELMISIKKKNVVRFAIYGDGDFVYWTEYELAYTSDVVAMMETLHETINRMK